MHGSAGLHSAMAIKRQRRLRAEQKKKAAERRLSSRTSMDSMDSMERLANKKNATISTPADGSITSIGMLHLGVCFCVLGIFLIGSGLLPDDVVTWRGGGWWNELVVTGIFVTTLGIFLIALNRVMSRREEDELQEYVQSQLTRSRSGHRLERDIETGGLTTKHHRKYLEKQRENKDIGVKIDLPPVHSPHNKSAPLTAIHNGEIQLEKILEEDVFEKPEIEIRALDYRESISNTTTASLSPGTPSETKELISNGRHFSFNSRQY